MKLPMIKKTENNDKAPVHDEALELLPLPSRVLAAEEIEAAPSSILRNELQSTPQTAEQNALLERQ